MTSSADVPRSIWVSPRLSTVVADGRTIHSEDELRRAGWRRYVLAEVTTIDTSCSDEPDLTDLVLCQGTIVNRTPGRWQFLVNFVDEEGNGDSAWVPRSCLRASSTTRAEGGGS